MSPILPYIELMKPRLTSLVIFTTWLGYALADRWVLGSDPTATATRGLTPLFHTLFGSWWVAAGAAALNQYLERDLDARMDRTKTRPLPQKRLTPHAALVFGIVITLVGALELWIFANPLTSFLSLVSWSSYLFIYTPLKTRTSLCTLVGAVPGAIPPMMGWTAVTNRLEPPAWVLFGILFLWQLPHFLAIAWMYREDYARAGFPMLPVVDPSGGSTSRMILLYCVLLIPMTLMPTHFGMVGPWYGAGAFLLGAVFLAVGVVAAVKRTVPSARRLLLASVTYLPMLLAWMLWCPA